MRWAVHSFCHTSIANSIVLFFTAPIFVALLAPVLLGEKLEKRTASAIVLSFAGIILVSNPQAVKSTSELIGIGAGIVSGICFALMIITSKASKEVTGLTLNFYQNLIAGVVTLPAMLLVGAIPTPRDFEFLLVLSLGLTVLSRTLFLNGVPRVKAQHAGIISYVEPISAPVYAWIFLHENISTNTIIGGLLVLLSGWLIMKNDSR